MITQREAAERIYAVLDGLDGAEIHVRHLAEATGLSRSQVHYGWRLLRTQRRNNKLAVMIERGRLSGYSVVDDDMAGKRDLLQQAKHIRTRTLTYQHTGEELERAMERTGITGDQRAVAISAIMSGVRAEEAMRSSMVSLGTALGMTADEVEEMLAPR